MFLSANGGGLNRTLKWVMWKGGYQFKAVILHQIKWVYCPRIREYNRDEHEPKELWLEGGDPDAYDENAQTVYPDIVVHMRGTNNNYLVIEFKKTSSRVGDEKDFTKLLAFCQQLGYQHALFVELSVGFNGSGISRVEWVSA